MGKSIYPSIPMPGAALDTITPAVEALRQTINLIILNGLSPNPNYTPSETAQVFVTYAALSKIGVVGPPGPMGPQGPPGTAGIPEAPNDANTYGRHALSWKIAGDMLAANNLSELTATQAAARNNIGAAPLASPALTGTPTAPTATAGTASGQIATTQFVVSSITSGAVASWNGRTGAVTLTLSDVTGVGGAPNASPNFTGTPAAPTAAPGTATTQLATTAFVTNAVASATTGVSSFNGRTGAVTLATADVTGAGGAPIASPALTGTPTAPTPPVGDNSTKVATTAFVAAAVGAGMRNRIINGEPRIDQRNAGASMTPINGNYTVDRFAYTGTQAGKFSCQQNLGTVTPPAGFTNYHGFVVASAYAVAAGDTFLTLQNIEGFNIADFGWGTSSAQPITVSVWVQSSVIGTHSGAIVNGAANRSYPFTFSIPVANTWTKIAVTIPGDIAGTWASNNATGIAVRLNLGSGSTYSAAPGVWGTTNAVGATGAVSIVGTAGATFLYTGVQLEPGSVATPFERRLYGTELSNCQRYYQPIGAGSAGTAYAAAGVQMSQPLRVTMRAAPTLTKIAEGSVALAGIGISTSTAGALSSYGSSPNYALWGMTGFSGLSVNLVYTGTNDFVAASAEL
jgi:hypothetical protein